MKACKKLKNGRGAYFLLVFCISFIPLVRLFHFLHTVGADSLGNDYVLWVSHIAEALEGKYSWTHLFRDSFTNGHCIPVVVLLDMADAYFFHLSIFPLLYFGAFLVIVRIFLLYSILTRETRSAIQCLWFPVLSFLVFSSSQLSTYEYDVTVDMEGVFQLGLVAGIWAFQKYPNRIQSAWIAFVGGLLASFSYGGGLMVWPFFLLLMIAFGTRRVGNYLIWLAGGLISFGIYYYYLVIHPAANPQPLLSLFNYTLWAQAFGWPLTQGFVASVAIWRGAVGIFLAASGFILFLLSRFREGRKAFLPGFLLIVFSFLQAWQISMVRANLICWYATHFMLFWIGILGVVYAFWARRAQLTCALRSLVTLWCSASVVFLTYFYATSNVTYLDKTFFLQARSPSSESCLRNFSTAPTYCEQRLFQWGVGNPQFMDYLGSPLFRHRLSVFSDHQIWTLQGDFVLEKVKVDEKPGIPDVMWSADLKSTPVPFTDFRHLNLFLHSPNSVEWSVDLPESLREATFHSAVAISQSAPHSPAADGLLVRVKVESSSGELLKVFEKRLGPEDRDWSEFSIPLTEYAGKNLKLTLTSDFGGNIGHDWAMYRFPYIDVRLGKRESQVDTHPEQRPANTDLSGVPIPLGEEDFVFDLENAEVKDENGRIVSQAPATTPQEVKGEKSFFIKLPRPIKLSDYRRLYFEIAAQSSNARSMRVFFFFKGNPQPFLTEIPLLADARRHSYTYELRLLELGQGEQLESLKAEMMVRDSGRTEVRWSDLRLLKN